MANKHPNPDNLKQFSSENQPERRGRKRNIFGALERENDLSLDDIRKVYKNILTTPYNQLDELKKKYNHSFVLNTIDVLKQENFGTLTGRSFIVTEVEVDEITGEERKVEKHIQERIKSYEMVKYMLERIFGKAKESGDLTVNFEPPASFEEQRKRVEELLSKAQTNDES
jgi:hypothetical protein